MDCFRAADITDWQTCTFLIGVDSGNGGLVIHTGEGTVVAAQLIQFELQGKDEIVVITGAYGHGCWNVEGLYIALGTDRARQPIFSIRWLEIVIAQFTVGTPADGAGFRGDTGGWNPTVLMGSDGISEGRLVKMEHGEVDLLRAGYLVEDWDRDAVRLRHVVMGKADKDGDRSIFFVLPIAKEGIWMRPFRVVIVGDTNEVRFPQKEVSIGGVLLLTIHPENLGGVNRCDMVGDV